MKIVVISPHPDDETLGAGGLILKCKEQGSQVFWINVTDVDESQGYDAGFVECRKRQIKKICEFYDFDGVYNLRYQPAILNEIDMARLIEAISGCIHEIQPDWVILPNPGDAHTDHRVTYDAAISCTKAFRYPSIKKIITMEIISETDFSKTGEAFSPNFFVDITDFISDKIEALKIYDTEIGEPPFPRSIEAVEALALLRGGMAGTKYAEAFKIIKEIDKIG